MYRWWIIPRNPIFNIYLHKFLRDDDDRALHDHPWISLSIILKGGYIECLPKGVRRFYNQGSIIYRRAVHRHRVELLRGCYPGGETFSKPTWTLFITGPNIREWGFWCPTTWGAFRFVHWEKFTAPDDKGKVGKGCGDV